MSAKKNTKQNKKPAVGSPAAGSQHKRAKSNASSAKGKNHPDNAEALARIKKKTQEQEKMRQRKAKEREKLRKQTEKENAKAQKKKNKETAQLEKEKQKAARAEESLRGAEEKARKEAAEKQEKARQKEQKSQQKQAQKERAQAEYLYQEKNAAHESAQPRHRSDAAAQPQHEPSNSRKKHKKKNPEKAGKKSFRQAYKRFSKKYNIGKIVAAIVILLGILSGIVFFTVSLASRGTDIPAQIKSAEYKGRVESETTAFVSGLSLTQQKSLAKSVKVKGNKTAFRFFVNDEIVISAYDDPVLLEFGSLSSNDCVLLAFLLDEKGNVLYRSLGVEPGKEIRSVYLFDELPYGEHKMTLVVNGYDAKTYKKVGTQTTQIQLKIGG